MTLNNFELTRRAFALVETFDAAPPGWRSPAPARGGGRALEEILPDHCYDAFVLRPGRHSVSEEQSRAIHHPDSWQWNSGVSSERPVCCASSMYCCSCARVTPCTRREAFIGEVASAEPPASGPEGAGLNRFNREVSRLTQQAR